MIKNIVPSWEDRNILLKELRQDLVSITEKNSLLCPVMVDAEEFLEDFYFSSSAKTLDMTVNKNESCRIGLNIDTIKNNKSIKGNIYFYGMGKWDYYFEIRDSLYDVSCYSFNGLGYKMNIREEKDRSDFIFSISDELEKILQVDEPFSQDYSPMYQLQTTFPRSYNKNVTWGWSDGYYDGPLSGYCYYDKNMFRFEVREEKDYSRQRIYSMHSISFFEKLIVKTNHWFWEHPIAFLPQKAKMFFYYSIIRSIFKIKTEKFKNRLPVGYFTY